jgi:hypothetical protein
MRALAANRNSAAAYALYQRGHGPLSYIVKSTVYDSLVYILASQAQKNAPCGDSQG